MLYLKIIHFSALRWNYICSERKMVLPDMYCQYVTSQEKITSKIVSPHVCDPKTLPAAFVQDLYTGPSFYTTSIDISLHLDNHNAI